MGVLATPFIVSIIPKKSEAEEIDLPKDALRDYLQYRVPLQLSADFYMFDLKEQLLKFDSWGEVNTIFVSNGARGGSGVSRLEREYLNPMRILTLSMPPEESEKLSDARDSFEKTMFRLSILTKGVRKDLPVELPPALISDALVSNNGQLRPIYQCVKYRNYHHY